MIDKEALKLALEKIATVNAMDYEYQAWAREALEEQPAQQPAQQEPVAYDKTELNCFAQDLYDQKMREGKHGHYESMFHVIHQCVKKVASPPAQPTWVGLTNKERADCWETIPELAMRKVEAKLKEKNT